MRIVTPRSTAAMLLLGWLAALFARGCHLLPVAWAVLLVPVWLALGVLACWTLVTVTEAAVRRSYRRRVERERQDFLRAMQSGFVQGRGIGNRRPRP